MKWRSGILFACLIIWTMFLTLHAANATDAELQITFIDVGKGDCALFECGGSTMLIDTSPSGAWSHIEEVIGEERQIDYLVLTHPHEDHIGNAARIVERNKVSCVILPPIEYGTKTYEKAMEAINEKGIEQIYPEVGDIFQLSDATITVYAPHPVAYANPNDWSIVLMVEYAGRKVLMTGDVEAAETDMLAYVDVLPLKADILKAAHHGSDSSSTFDFIAAVSPRYAIVSCNSTEDHDYPSVETAMSLYDCGVEDVLTTEVYGDVCVAITCTGKVDIQR